MRPVRHMWTSAEIEYALKKANAYVNKGEYPDWASIAKALNQKFDHNRTGHSCRQKIQTMVGRSTATSSVITPQKGSKAGLAQKVKKLETERDNLLKRLEDCRKPKVTFGRPRRRKEVPGIMCG